MSMTKTVSLEIAKRLKEAGWEQNERTENYFIEHKDGTGVIVSFDSLAYPGFNCCSPSIGNHTGQHFAAPDIPELLEALPKGVALRKTFSGSGYLAYFSTLENKEAAPTGTGAQANPANALALLWLELNKK